MTPATPERLRERRHLLNAKKQEILRIEWCEALKKQNDKLREKYFHNRHPFHAVMS